MAAALEGTFVVLARSGRSKSWYNRVLNVVHYVSALMFSLEKVLNIEGCCYHHTTFASKPMRFEV